MMRACRFFAAAFLAIVSGALSTAPAAAGLQVCNQTSYILNIAAGYQTNRAAFTHGWTRIVPGDCAPLFADPLTASAYLIYARSSQAHSGPARAWGGATKLCVKDANFALQSPLGISNCPGDDGYPLPFAPVATQGKPSWTMTLTELPELDLLDIAREAGIVRLLNDIGYKVGKNQQDGNRARDDALTSFRSRTKLPLTATNSDLFAALETAALRAAAPAGYSVCNDSDGDIWAAFALRSGINWVSRGWWKVPPAGCAKMLTIPLAADKVYLLAASRTDSHLVTGPTKFCTSEGQFEVSGRDKCAAQGFSETGFAATDTKGRSGYAAHIGKDGLEPPVSQPDQLRTPK